MTTELFFDDPRHRRSEELAVLAESSDRTGDLTAALGQYAEAALLEEANALDVPGDMAGVRAVLALGAVGLWLRAERWDDAARAGCTFLSQPDKLTPDGLREIRSLVDRAWRTREAEEALGWRGSYVVIDVTLSGGVVRGGVAPSAVVAERRDVLTALLLRVAEWRSGKRCRGSGPSTLASHYDILEAPSVAGSCGLRLCLGATSPQQLDDGAAPSAKEVVDQLLGLAQAVASGPEHLGRKVEDGSYARTFLRGFRELAPDGRAIAEVLLGGMVRGRITRVATLTPETRQSLTVVLRGRGEGKTAWIDGVIKKIKLCGEDIGIGVMTPERERWFRFRRWEYADTIGSKLNRRVSVLARRERNEYHEVEEWADDVVLTGDPSRELTA